jgi:hypothetical protein
MCIHRCLCFTKTSPGLGVVHLGGVSRGAAMDSAADAWRRRPSVRMGVGRRSCAVDPAANGSDRATHIYLVGEFATVDLAMEGLDQILPYQPDQSICAVCFCVGRWGSSSIYLTLSRRSPIHRSACHTAS